jgi:REP element-mobilizing transposase RayT
MPQARELVLPPHAVGTYHVLSRCTRRDFLLGGKHAHRRAWVAGLLAELLDGFAIDLHAFAIMSNHVHLVLRPRPDLASSWSARQVATRGLTQIPVRSGAGLEALPVTRTLTDRYAENETWIKDHRERLSSLTWFMRLFKQRIARRANAEDDCRGHFWESRFLSVPLLDMGAVIGCMAYVDRNPLRAQMVSDPADATFTSIAHRLCAAGEGRKATFFCAEDRQLGAHLTSLAECRPVDPLTGERPRSHLTLDDYRALVVPGKPTSEAARVCAALGINPSAWYDAQREGGRFQGVAVGSRLARAAFAQTQGKQIIADKTGVWSDEA